MNCPAPPMSESRAFGFLAKRLRSVDGRLVLHALIDRGKGERKCGLVLDQLLHLACKVGYALSSPEWRCRGQRTRCGQADRDHPRKDFSTGISSSITSSNYFNGSNHAEAIGLERAACPRLPANGFPRFRGCLSHGGISIAGGKLRIRSELGH